MREIKFRAWVNNSEMITDFIVYRGKASINEYGDIIRLGDSILMQYTGLKDKNGVEIYEGDIIKLKNEWSDTCWNTLVRFNNGGFMVDVEEVDYNITCIGFLDDDTIVEVIGNIHEHKHLLK